MYALAICLKRQGVSMTVTDNDQALLLDENLTRRALKVAVEKATDMADSVLKVPLHYYHDSKFAEMEQSQILRYTPLAVMPSAQVPNPNDYAVRSVLGDSLLVTRDKNAQSHVFLNYCRHRGATPACGSGNAARFSCPYHAWTYKNTGELFAVPGRQGFDGIDIKDYGLVELPNQERHGFIWAVLTVDEGIDVDGHLGEFGPHMAELDYGSFGFHDLREFESNTLWKSALEAFAEGYHFPFVHGESLIGMNALPNTAVYDEYGKHHRICFPMNWITSLSDDSSGSWAALDNMAVIYWIYPKSGTCQQQCRRRDHRPAALGRGLHRAPQLDGKASRLQRGHACGLRRNIHGRPRRSPRRGLWVVATVRRGDAQGTARSCGHRPQ